MSGRRDELRAWARPEGILLRDEFVRLGEFLELFEEQLRLLAGDEPPTIQQRMAARRIAAALWSYDRMTDDRHDAARFATGELSRELVWAEQFRALEVRARLNVLVMQEIHDARRFVGAEEQDTPIVGAAAVPVARGRPRRVA